MQTQFLYLPFLAGLLIVITGGFLLLRLALKSLAPELSPVNRGIVAFLLCILGIGLILAVG